MALSLERCWFSMMKSRRILSCLIGLSVLFAMAVAPASAGRVESRADGTTVIYIKISPEALPDPNLTDTYSKAQKEIVRAFQDSEFTEIFAAKYRDKYKADPAKYGKFNWDKVEIRLEPSTGIRVTGVENDLLAIAGGVAPDVIFLNFRKSDTYIRNDFLYPLDEYIGDLSNATFSKEGVHRDTQPTYGLTDAELNFRVHPKIWPVMRRKGGSGKVRTWAIPTSEPSGKVLLYRKDIFDRYGVPYPTAKWTWDDLLNASRRVTDPESNIYAFTFSRDNNESWYWITFLWSAGGEVMVRDETDGSWECVFDGSNNKTNPLCAAKALDFYARLNSERWERDGSVHRGYVFFEAGGWQKWNNGEIAMNLAYIDATLFARLNPELTGMVPVPFGPPDANGNRIRGGELNSSMMGIFREVENPVIRDACWEYIRWVNCKEALRIKTRIMVEGGLGKFMNPDYLDLFGYPEIKRQVSKEWSQTFKIAMETGQPEPYGKNSNIAYELMTKPVQEARQRMRNGGFSDNEDERLQQMQEILDKYNALANEKMIGNITPDERKKRDIVAVIVLVLIAVSFVLVFRRIIRAFTPPKIEGVEKKPVKWGFRKYAWAYIILIPAVLSVFLWQYVPLASGSAMAFQDYRLVGQSTWVGVENFGDLLFSNEWWQACYNTVRYSILVISMTFLPPIILAIMLQEVPHGKIFFRTIYYLPAVITGLVLSLLWIIFYAPNETGVLNSIILKIPGIGFVGAAIGLLAAALLFARRMWYHDMELAAWLFALAGIGLFLTVGSMSRPIFFRADENLSETLPAILYMGFGVTLLGSGLSFLWKIFRHSGEKLKHQSSAIIAAALALLVLPALALLNHYSTDLDPELYSVSLGPLLWVAGGGLVMASSILVGGILAKRDESSRGSIVVLSGLGVMVVCILLPLLMSFGKPIVSGLSLFMTRLLEFTPEAYDWLGDPKTALQSIIIPMVWAGMGPGCLIYLAALKGIADDYYEASDVDGATFIDKIMFVVFPILKPLILINFIGAFIASFYGATAQILVMTGGGANTTTAGLHIFKEAYIYLRFGPATAMAWILAFMLIGFTVNQLKILSRLEFRTTGGDKK